MKKSKYRRRGRSTNGFSPRINRSAGSFVYYVLHALIILVSYKIWGIEMFSEAWFYLMHLVAFSLTRQLLIGTKFWNY